MVKIGDMIELENGKEGEVINIQDTFCGRYLITYVPQCYIKQFFEGDVDFKVIKHGIQK